MIVEMITMNEMYQIEENLGVNYLIVYIGNAYGIHFWNMQIIGKWTPIPVNSASRFMHLNSWFNALIGIPVYVQ